MNALFSDSVHEVIDSGRFTFTVEEWFKLDAKNGPYEMRSGTSGTKETPTWHSVARRLQERFAKVTWFAENVVCEPFVATTKALFPDSVHEVIGSGRFTAEQHKRAYFASPGFDFTKLTELDGGCTLEEWFKRDAKNGPYEMRSGSFRIKESTTWHSAARRAPTLTSNGLIARNVRTGEVWRVLTKAMEALRGPAALPPSLKPAVLTRRQAASRAVSGAVSLQIARKLGALVHDSSGRARVWRERV